MNTFSCTHAGTLPGISGCDSPDFCKGVFKKMFDGEKPNAPPDRYLRALAATMVEMRQPFEEHPLRLRRLHAGYTYLAQFIDHDITFDKRLPFQTGNTGKLVPSIRTPCLDLDSIYGGGPTERPEMYQSDKVRLKITENAPSPGEQDLLRTSDQTAIIGDPRNDANVIISQLHLAFLKFHNKIADAIEDTDKLKGPALYEQARSSVLRHYQWIVLNEFLPLIAPDALAGALRERRHFNIVRSQDVYIPFEFSIGAFRFGHSMVRHDYILNSELGGQIVIFDIEKPNDPTAMDLRGFRKRPPRMKIDWRRFFSTSSNPSAKEVQLARPIDALITAPLSQMPVSVAQDATELGRSLPYRNLIRAKDNEMLSGQTIARAMKVAEKDILGSQGRPFEVDQSGLQGDLNNIGNTGLSTQELTNKFQDNTPFWYYILKEAQEFHRGERLGPVGARITAEVLVGLLAVDGRSILNKDKGWKPENGKFGCREAGKYFVTDLLSFAET